MFAVKTDEPAGTGSDPVPANVAIANGEVAPALYSSSRSTEVAYDPFDWNPSLKTSISSLTLLTSNIMIGSLSVPPSNCRPGTGITLFVTTRSPCFTNVHRVDGESWVTSRRPTGAPVRTSSALMSFRINCIVRSGRSDDWTSKRTSNAVTDPAGTT